MRGRSIATDSERERRKQQRAEVRAAYDAVSAAENLTNTAGDTSAARADQRRRLDARKLEYLRLKRTLALEYPEQRELVLPTRFGNVLRAFEMYAGDVYGVESIHAWPRLLAVVPKDYQAMLADARAPVDFFVSLVFISFILGAVALIRTGTCLFSDPSTTPMWVFLAAAAVAVFVARLCYLAALSSAIAWGEVVKSTFDLYLPALASAMGYQLPKTAGERRKFWEALASQFQFHEPIQPEAWQQTASPPSGGEEGASKKTEKRGEGDGSEEAGGTKDADDNDDPGETAAGAATDDASRSDDATVHG
jgi:hypothetical protein